MVYFIATPIGNLDDISYRAIETLKKVDIIACEDTRKSLILLNHYNIKKRLISYHKNNEYNSANGIIDLLKQGKQIAVISDCGMPIISDPGSVLIQKLLENKIDYTIIPGANAGLSALVLSGFNARYFSFLGFLPEKKKERITLLKKVKKYENTLIFYLPSHDLDKNFKELFEVFGDRKVCLVSEITKLFEKKYYFNLGKLPVIDCRGEFVLIVEGAKESLNQLENLTLQEQIDFYIINGLTKKEAIKKVAKENKIKNIYKILDNAGE